MARGSTTPFFQWPIINSDDDDNKIIDFNEVHDFPSELASAWIHGTYYEGCTVIRIFNLVNLKNVYLIVSELTISVYRERRQLSWLVTDCDRVDWTSYQMAIFCTLSEIIGIVKNNNINF